MSNIKELEAELLEQARVNGMGSEREAALMAKVERKEVALRLAVNALTQLVIATKHLKPCPGTLEMAECAIKAAEGEV